MWIRALSIEPAIDWSFAAPGGGLRFHLATRFYHKDGKRREASILVINDRLPQLDRAEVGAAMERSRHRKREPFDHFDLLSKGVVRAIP